MCFQVLRPVIGASKMDSSDESATITPPRKQRRCSEVSPPSNNPSQEKSGSEDDDEDDFNLIDPLESLLPGSFHSEHGANSEEDSTDSGENGCAQRAILEDQLKEEELLNERIIDEFIIAANEVADEGDPDSAPAQITPAMEEDLSSNLSYLSYNESQSLGFHDEKSLQSSQLSNDVGDEKSSFNDSTILPYDLDQESRPVLEDKSMDDTIGSERNVEILNSSADDQTFLPIEIFKTPTKVTNCSSTPVKAASSTSMNWARIDPDKTETSFPPQLDINNTESSSSDSDDQEIPSSSEEENSDSGSEGLAEDNMTEFFEVHNLSEIEDQNLDNSSESILGVDFAISKALVLCDLKVYPGCSFSVQEGVLQIMNLYLKNKLSKKGLNRVIQTFCNFLPENHNLPTTSYQMLSHIESLAHPVPAVKHFYCEACLCYLGESDVGECTICKEPTKFGHFYIYDIPALVKYFFESRNLADILDYEAEKRSHRDTNVLTDLKDGRVYQSLNQNRAKYDLNLLFNTDGVRVRKGSKRELWLAMITIAELPIHLQRSFLTVVGVWYHEKKPDMRVFLKPLAESLQRLDQNGVEWTHPTTKEKHKSCVKLPVTILDAPARAIVQNVKAFNSRYGCNLCEIKTRKSVPVPNRKAVRVYHYVHDPPLRSKEQMFLQAETAVLENKESIKGVRGPSVLSIIPSVDISKCVVPEYLHSVLIGVVKQVLTIWCTKPGPWSLKQRISEIDVFLSSFKHPSFVHRSLRQLKSLKNWKASDFYYFLLFEAIPSLKGHLPDRFLQHFMLLVKGIFTLLKASITEAEVDEAESLLKLFVNQFMALYGDRELTHNVHQLCHLAFCVRLYGPLFCFSAFSCEDLNGMIAKTSHGTMYVDAEIVNNIKICQGILMLENIVRGHHGLNVSNLSSFSEGEFLGNEVSDKLLSKDELGVLPDANNPILYARAKLGFDDFTSEIYKVLNSENFYVMWNHQGKLEYGSIKYFAKCQSDNFVVIRLFEVDHTKVFYHSRTFKSIEQFIPVRVSNRFVSQRFSEVASTIVKVGKIGSYIYVRPHLYRFVL